MAERPAWLPEKFWSTEKDEINVEGLASSYTELERKFSTRLEDLTKQVRTDFDTARLKARPQKPEAYTAKVKLGEDEVELDGKNALIGWWRQTAYDMGLDQAGFQKGLDAYVQAYQAEQPNVEEELKTLGENGQERVERVTGWMTNRLGKDVAETLGPLTARAKGVMALEEVMKLVVPDSGLRSDGAPGGKPKLTREDLTRMQNDPRYFDPQKRDPAFVRQVREGYEALYGKGKTA